MEEITTFEYTPAPDSQQMRLSTEDKYLLADGAKWAKFISIVMFVCIGLVLAVILFSMIAMGVAGFSSYDMYQNPYGPAGGSTVMFWPLMIFCLVIYMIQLIPTILLFRFSKKTQEALATGNETLMTESFRNLRGYFKVTGILVIVGLVFGLIFGILMGVMMGSAM